MSESSAHATPARPTVHFSPAALAKLRSLSTPRPTPREFVRTASRAEIAALAGLLVAIIAIALVYSKSIAPGQFRRIQLGSQREQNAAKLDELRFTAANPATVRTQLEGVKLTLDQFRGESLKPRMAGRLAIVSTIEQLTRTTGVRLASDVEFSTNLTAASSESQRGGLKVAKGSPEKGDVTSYPSLEVSYAISGTYPQLRQFISGFERSAQFVVFNSISLSTSTEPTGDGELAVQRPRAAPGDVITLEVDMTAFFQPEGAASFVVALPEAPAQAPAP
jgi:hypothetical protein